MTQALYNFGPGPAMLPASVLEQVQREMLDYQGTGVSIVELSHRGPVFFQLLDDARALFRELTGLPDSHTILFMHGGAQMQFSAVPLNLMASKPAHRAQYAITGKWGRLAEAEARKYGDTSVLLDGKDSDYTRVPEWDSTQVDPEASYVHITTNNTLYGTQWSEIPDTGNVPLAADATSDILSRQFDYSRFGVLFAGLQKNLGPAGAAVVLVRNDLFEHALPETPKLLDYTIFRNNRTTPNTINTFAVYVMKLVLEWVKAEGGVEQMEARNSRKSARLYGVLDDSGFYLPSAHPESRSQMNVTFHLPSDELLQRFLSAADAAGFYAVKGHAEVGGIRASIYNAMPYEGVEALAQFMLEFERRNG